MWSIIAFGSPSISFAKIPRSSPIIIEGSTLVKVTTYKSAVLAMVWAISALLDSEMRKAGKTRVTIDTLPNSINGFSPKIALTQTPRKAQITRT